MGQALSLPDPEERKRGWEEYQKAKQDADDAFNERGEAEERSDKARNAYQRLGWNF